MVLSLLVACVMFVVKLVKSIHEREKTEGAAALLDAVAPIVEIAETFTNFSGVEKKQFIMTKVNQFAIENSIAFYAKAVS